MEQKKNNVLTRFWLDFDPPTVTAQEAKIKVIYDKLRKKYIPQKYMPPELADAQQKYLAYLSQHKPLQKFAGALGLKVEWYFLTEHRSMDGQWKVTKPDTDNLDKLLKDCMTKCGFWYDDNQVVLEMITKQWALNPGIMITIYDLNTSGKEDMVEQK